MVNSSWRSKNQNRWGDDSYWSSRELWNCCPSSPQTRTRCSRYGITRDRAFRSRKSSTLERRDQTAPQIFIEEVLKVVQALTCPLGNASTVSISSVKIARPSSGLCSSTHRENSRINSMCWGPKFYGEGGHYRPLQFAMISIPVHKWLSSMFLAVESPPCCCGLTIIQELSGAVLECCTISPAPKLIKSMSLLNHSDQGTMLAWVHSPVL